MRLIFQAFEWMQQEDEVHDPLFPIFKCPKTEEEAELMRD